jgi:hypothetical protein
MKPQFEIQGSRPEPRSQEGFRGRNNHSSIVHPLDSLRQSSEQRATNITNAQEIGYTRPGRLGFKAAEERARERANRVKFGGRVTVDELLTQDFPGQEAQPKLTRYTKHVTEVSPVAEPVLQEGLETEVEAEDKVAVGPVTSSEWKEKSGFLTRVHEKAAAHPLATKFALSAAGAAAVVTGAYYAEGAMEGNVTHEAGADGQIGRFSDIDDSAFKVAIEDLATRNIINGFSDGTFRPNEQVTRQQFAKMVDLEFGLKPTGSEQNTFPDVHDTGELYPAKYIALAVENNIIRGYSDGTFGPTKPILGQNIITMTIRAMDSLYPGLLRTPPVGYKSPYFGLGLTAENEANAAKAAYNGLLDIVKDRWTPTLPATRGHVAQVLSNAGKYVEEHGGGTTTSTTSTTETTTTTESQNFPGLVKIDSYGIDQFGAIKPDLLSQFVSGIKELLPGYTYEFDKINYYKIKNPNDPDGKQIKFYWPVLKPPTGIIRTGVRFLARDLDGEVESPQRANLLFTTKPDFTTYVAILGADGKQLVEFQLGGPYAKQDSDTNVDNFYQRVSSLRKMTKASLGNDNKTTISSEVKLILDNAIKATFFDENGNQFVYDLVTNAQQKDAVGNLIQSW